MSFAGNIVGDRCPFTLTPLQGKAEVLGKKDRRSAQIAEHHLLNPDAHRIVSDERRKKRGLVGVCSIIAVSSHIPIWKPPCRARQVGVGECPTLDEATRIPTWLVIVNLKQKPPASR